MPTFKLQVANDGKGPVRVWTTMFPCWEISYFFS